MRARLAQTDRQPRPRPLLATYHAFCARILRADGTHVRVPSTFVIYDTADQLKAARLAIDEIDYDKDSIPPRSLVWQIGQWKNQMRTPQELRATEKSYRNAQLVDGFERYEKILRRADALDFDDLLLKAVSLLRRHDRVREKYAARYRHILVDEYQDTNHAQYELTHLLGRDHRNVCAVGDPDQAIYGWRCADIRNIQAFAKDFPEHEVVNLERNSDRAATPSPPPPRSSPTTRTAPTRPCGPDAAPARASSTCAPNPTTTRRTHHPDRRRDAPRQTAVLYRTNAQSRLIEDALRRAVIAGLEEGLLPHNRSLETRAGVEEERRLFYVGITRTMNRLPTNCTTPSFPRPRGSHRVAARAAARVELLPAPARVTPPGNAVGSLVPPRSLYYYVRARADHTPTATTWRCPHPLPAPTG